MSPALLTEYPLTPSGAERQCAWCWLIVDAHGHYSIASTRKVRSATHGICPSCKEAMRGEIAASPPSLLAA